MRTLVWSGLILITIIFQAAVIPLIGYKGVRPDLLLIIAVSTGLLFGKEQGVGVGFFAGLIQDLASGNIFGLNTLAKMATGYVAGLAERKVFKENILLPVLATVAATLFHGAIIVVLLAGLGYKVDIAAVFIYNFLPQLAYNVVLAIPVHLLVVRVSRIGSSPRA
ncbi:Rod shape-determining protein MreD [Thermosinus carboxydivorans Nor1]|uniref:Rod shape-determining protein MreD n=1 Tax=Thermosinus carboxydivorans Nor1 TaxID=401526 RepID=A1HP02_9FIRM|nr:rod shape-determining protein MreD [Thermosinus carboxydivorans]EAX48110.1 Rod shape-determining protein MreD [Thermosinus carboxydivorans Nor1]